MSEAEILRKLDTIENELKTIKKHLIDADLLITDDDLESLEEGEKDLRNKRTMRLV